MAELIRNARIRSVPAEGSERRKRGVSWLVRHLQAILLLVSPVLAQVTIKNPDQLEVPVQRVQIVFQTTCQAVSREFQVPEKDVEFPLLLVLGDPIERYIIDEHQLGTLYLYRWNEAQFAASVMMLAIEHMVTQSRRDRMVREILKRSNSIDTIPINALRKH